jgi:hypothetical protein
MAWVRGFTASCLAIANVLGTCVQLNGEGLDPALGIVAVAAARVLHRGRLVVIKKKSSEIWNSESGLNVTDCMTNLACIAHGGHLPQVIEGCSITAHH